MAQGFIYQTSLKNQSTAVFTIHFKTFLSHNLSSILFWVSFVRQFMTSDFGCLINANPGTVKSLDVKSKSKLHTLGVGHIVNTMKNRNAVFFYACLGQKFQVKTLLSRHCHGDSTSL